jgi:starch synthase
MQKYDCQLICLGSGGADLENGLRWLESTYRDRARSWVGFNEPFSHKLTAAADILLMPSRFEVGGDGGRLAQHVHYSNFWVSS